MAVDLLRIISAYWVAIYHLMGGHGWFSNLRHPFPNLIRMHHVGVFGSVVRLGFLGVPIFFVISGFAIASNAAHKDVNEFYKARLSRLLPAFLVSIVITIAGWRYGFRGRVNYDSIVATLNLSWAHQGVIQLQGSYWTLWPEVRFYILFATLVLISSKKFGYEKSLFWFSCLWLFSIYLLPETGSGFLNNLLISDYGCFFILGVMLFNLCSVNSTYKTRILFPLIGCAIICIASVKSWVLSWDSEAPKDWRIGVLIFLIAILVFVYSPRFSIQGKVATTLIKSQAQNSYSFYLLQEGLGFPLASFAYARGLTALESISVGLFSVLLISNLFSNFFENKLIRFVKVQLGKENAKN